ncbi:MAG: ABC transporter permease [Clostridia bacterium]|nr:ABC transporter permease [Clostridia bacterium]
MGNKEFHNFNPQTEFISVEENSEFQGICAAGAHLFIRTVLVKISILTKGCRFYRQSQAICIFLCRLLLVKVICLKEYIMLGYLIKRIVIVFGVLWMVSTLTYFTVHVTPGDTATAILYSIGGENAVSEKNIEHVRDKLDLNRPVYLQYFEWVTNSFKGNFGTSYKYNKPVLYMIKLRLPNTIKLGITAFLISVAVSIPLGIISALNHNRIVDHLSRIFTLLTSSFPSFWIAIIFIIFFALKLKFLPVSGMDSPKSIVLPAITLSLGMMAPTTRMMRTSMLDVMGQDYIWVSRAKGLKESAIIWRHVLRNAIPPIITVLGLQIGHILGGAVIIENIFSWPGVGGLLIDAINAKDTPMIEGCVLVVAFGYTFINLVVDIIYACIDPRLKYSGEGK